MKKFALSLVILMAAPLANAKTSCQIAIGTGVGHLFSGEVFDITPRNEPTQEKVVENGAFRIEIAQSGSKVLLSGTRKDTGAALDFNSAELGEASLHVAKLPEDLFGIRELKAQTPGAAGGKSIFLMAICTAKN